MGKNGIVKKNLKSIFFLRLQCLASRHIRRPLSEKLARTCVQSIVQSIASLHTGCISDCRCPGCTGSTHTMCRCNDTFVPPDVKNLSRHSQKWHQTRRSTHLHFTARLPPLASSQGFWTLGNELPERARSTKYCVPELCSCVCAQTLLNDYYATTFKVFHDLFYETRENILCLHYSKGCALVPFRSLVGKTRIAYIHTLTHTGLLTGLLL